jgi:hypothetical protein
MASVDFFKTLDDRKRRLWAEVCRSAARHPEWPRDALEDFFLFWTENGRDGIMKFERQQDFSVGHRIGSYMKRRRYLEIYWTSKLDKVRGKKQSSSLEQKRAAAMDEEAQKVYDSFFAAQEARQKEGNAAGSEGKEEKNGEE